MDAKRLVGLLALLGAAFAGGFIVGGERTSSPDARQLLDVDVRHEDPSPVSRDRRQGAAPTLAAGASLAEVPADLVAAIEALPPVDIPVGTKHIDARVVTDRGLPLAGVVVLAQPEMPQALQWPEGMPSAEQTSEDIARRLRHMVNQIRWRNEATLQATTSEDGSCRIEGARDVTHYVSAELEGWIIKGQLGAYYSVTPDAAIEFVAAPRTGIVADVLMPDRTPAESARIEFRSSNGGRTVGWRPAHPLAEVPPGTYGVSALAGVDTEYASPKQVVSVSRDEPPPDVQMQLQERTVLRGCILCDAYETGPLHVRLVQVPDGDRPDERLLEDHDATSEPVVRDGTPARFDVFDLMPGRYIVGVYRGRRDTPPISTKVVELQSGRNAMEIGLPPPSRSDYAVLHVRDAQGRPLAGVSFSASMRGENGVISTGGSMSSARPDGEYWVRHVESGGQAKRRTWSIRVSHPEYGSQLVTYADPRNAVFDVKFEEPAVGLLRVRGVDQDVYRGRVSVSLARSDSGSSRHETGPARLDFEGRLRLDPLQPGTYEVRAHIAHGEHDAVWFPIDTVTLESGSQDVSVAMPALYSIEIAGLQRSAILVHQFDGKRGSHGIRLAPAAGRSVEIDGLPAGSYRLHVGGQRLEFSLPGTSVVTVK